MAEENKNTLVGKGLVTNYIAGVMNTEQRDKLKFKDGISGVDGFVDHIIDSQSINFTQEQAEAIKQRLEQTIQLNSGNVGSITSQKIAAIILDNATKVIEVPVKNSVTKETKTLRTPLSGKDKQVIFNELVDAPKAKSSEEQDKQTAKKTNSGTEKDMNILLAEKLSVELAKNGTLDILNQDRESKFSAADLASSLMVKFQSLNPDNKEFINDTELTALAQKLKTEMKNHADTETRYDAFIVMVEENLGELVKGTKDKKKDAKPEYHETKEEIIDALTAEMVKSEAFIKGMKDAKDEAGLKAVVEEYLNKINVEKDQTLVLDKSLVAGIAAGVMTEQSKDEDKHEHKEYRGNVELAANLAGKLNVKKAVKNADEFEYAALTDDQKKQLKTPVAEALNANVESFKEKKVEDIASGIKDKTADKRMSRWGQAGLFAAGAVAIGGALYAGKGKEVDPDEIEEEAANEPSTFWKVTKFVLRAAAVVLGAVAIQAAVQKKGFVETAKSDVNAIKGFWTKKAVEEKNNPPHKGNSIA